MLKGKHLRDLRFVLFCLHKSKSLRGDGGEVADVAVYSGWPKNFARVCNRFPLGFCRLSEGIVGFCRVFSCRFGESCPYSFVL